MNHSPAYILAQYLIGEGLVVDPTESEAGDWAMYVGNLPDGANVDHNAIASVDTTPVKDGRIMDGLPLFHFGIQLMLRATDYNVGYAKASALADSLGAVKNEDVTVESGSTYRIANLTQATGVVALGQEPGTKRRWMFSVNFLATMKEV